MILLVGLGNPDAKYAGNRHNAGFMAVDAIAEAQGFGPEREKFRGLVREGRLGPEKALILKPMTYYNEAGRAVQAAAQFYKLAPDDVVVFHDEIDLAPAKLRVKKGGGLAGNNGLRSIAAQFSADTWRVRIGVGHPGDKKAVVAHVLKDFAKEEREGWVAEMLDGIGRAAPKLVPLSEENGSRFVSAVIQPGAADKPKARSAPRPSPAPAPVAPERANPFIDALASLGRKKD
ncbi:aminoacyl-tRNA hydrolase [Parvularcula dongshanensis]|uniref:Peptidyl-tRNA hydrolase n=1 Tax=Parvularcula dongshanensis TaxID=1173995 RepID=A0A840I4M9_9PROT|nr:aminoacyl-tRNA hydrolase [Parvularcula dongshanensis]MBB4659128.1 PTH1 family peptidyl-tRNA hydrolase [Parvularcula dongshanensis]